VQRPDCTGTAAFKTMFGASAVSVLNIPRYNIVAYLTLLWQATLCGKVTDCVVVANCILCFQGFVNSGYGVNGIAHVSTAMCYCVISVCCRRRVPVDEQ
jgi:uncharacterized membrane protein YfbV (UPF0208 family)